MTRQSDSRNLLNDSFWLSHLRLGFAVFTAEAVAILGYLRASPNGPHRVALTAIAAISVLVGALSFIALPVISRQPWRAGFSLTWSLVAGWALAGCAHLDGGIDSPLLYLLLFPVIYAALAYGPRAVVVCAVSALAQLAVVGASDADVRLAPGALFMIAAVIGGMSVFAVAASIYRSKLQRNGARLVNELAALANTDGLTGCLNHRAFHERLASEIERALRHRLPLCLIVVDIDNFKTVNDTYGHAAGDDALLAVTGALRGEVRSVDVVGRVGGDEFGVILTDTSLAGAETHARRISRALARLREPKVSLSIGISGLDAAEPTSVQLLRDADRALYHVKGTGRDGIAATSAHGAPMRVAS